MPEKTELFTVGERVFHIEYYDEADYFSIEIWEELSGESKNGMPEIYVYAVDFLTETEALAHYYTVLSDPIRYI